MAAIFLVVMAFAQPVFNQDRLRIDDANRHEVLLVDNSVSMFEGEASAYDQVVNQLTDYLEKSSSDQLFQLLHHGVFLIQSWYGKDSVILVTSIQPVPLKPLNEYVQEFFL